MLNDDVKKKYEELKKMDVESMSGDDKYILAMLFLIVELGYSYGRLSQIVGNSRMTTLRQLQSNASVKMEQYQSLVSHLEKVSESQKMLDVLKAV